MTNTSSESPIRLVLAGAGTGKTRRVVRQIAETVTKGVPPTSIVATTFTVRAATELRERARRHLLEQDRRDEADQLLLGRVGTVNAVGGRLVADFVFDLGLSPRLEVLAEEGQSLFFRKVLAEVLDRHWNEVRRSAGRLGVDFGGVVLEIVQKAAANGIDRDELEACAHKSWDSLKRYLGEPVDGEELDRKFRTAVLEVRVELEQRAEASQLGQRSSAALRLLREVPVYVALENVPWIIWGKIARQDVNAGEKEVFRTVKNAASFYVHHNRLHDDLRIVIKEAFSCASELSEIYNRNKNELGLIDFVDQERYAIEVARNERARTHLREDIEQMFVDEFQDTSPVQLAMFVEYAKILAENENGPTSLWVGDPKQAIYAFRGTDPELVDAVARGLGGGQTVERLSECWRARPPLVAFANDVFAPAFAAQGADEASVRLEPKREEQKEFGPPLHLWRLNGGKWEDALRTLAYGIREVLDNGEHWCVEDRGETRPPRGGDIAILCTTNRRCGEVANALAKAGIEVAIQRERLLDTPEAAYAFAAFRYLVDPSDSLALAEMAHYREGLEEGRVPEWLEARLRHQRERETSGEVEQKPRDRWVPESIREECAALDRWREHLDSVTPGEALETALAVSGAADLARSLGDPVRRLGNLDALRGLAGQYEDLCRRQRQAATAPGLVTWMRRVPKGGQQPASPSENAVQVLTYHRAKGLEWPIVVLLDLQDGERSPSPFGAHVEPREGRLDPERPLEGRWVRYWPDFGRGFDATSTEEFCMLKIREEKERVRLLYVGMTRARDYLILAARAQGKNPTAWLDLLKDVNGNTIIVLPDATDEPQDVMVNADGNEHRMHVRKREVPEASMDPQETSAMPVFGPRWRQSAAKPETVRLPYRLRPSAETAVANVEIVEEISLGDRLRLAAGNDGMERIGEALHAFFAADRPDKGDEWRRSLAERIVRRWGAHRIRAEDVVEASNRLLRFLDDRYPGGTRHSEWPVAGRIGRQRVRGRLDMLVRSRDRVAIIDHKTFPGRQEEWSERAREAGGQLGIYARLIEDELGASPDLWVHLPIVGRMVRIEIQR